MALFRVNWEAGGLVLSTEVPMNAGGFMGNWQKSSLVFGIRYLTAVRHRCR